MFFSDNHGQNIWNKLIFARNLLFFSPCSNIFCPRLSEKFFSNVGYKRDTFKKNFFTFLLSSIGRHRSRRSQGSTWAARSCRDTPWAHLGEVYPWHGGIVLLSQVEQNFSDNHGQNIWNKPIFSRNLLVFSPCSNIFCPRLSEKLFLYVGYKRCHFFNFSTQQHR